MAERIRFLSDESVDVRIAHALRRHGCDGTTTNEVGLRVRSGEMQIIFARDEGRVIIAWDADFLRFASDGMRHAGIVISTTGNW